METERIHGRRMGAAGVHAGAICVEGICSVRICLAGISSSKGYPMTPRRLR